MKLFFPYLDRSSGGFYRSYLRIIKKIHFTKSDLINPFEIVVCKDFKTGETLLARPTFEKNKYTGRLYEKLLNLKISLNPDTPISKEDKDKIMSFVSLYGQPAGNQQEISRSIKSDPNTSYFEDGDEINWLFCPYKSRPQDRTIVGYFEAFQNMLRDFVNSAEIVKSGKTFELGGLQTVFNNGLAGNHLILNPDYGKGHYLSWENSTCLNLCYLELYGALLSGQTLKTCKYCNAIFESTKSNEVRCHNCRSENTYRKTYYQKNIQVEREKAKTRMAKLRSKSSNK